VNAVEDADRQVQLTLQLRKGCKVIDAGRKFHGMIQYISRVAETVKFWQIAVSANIAQKLTLSTTLQRMGRHGLDDGD